MNSLTRMPQSQIVDPANQWFWNGSQWVCGCDPDPGCPPQFPPTAPPWFPPPAGQPPWYPGANGGVSFSPTAPPNPIRGAFWWDGATLWLFDGAAWVATGGAGGGGTTPPSVNPPANPSNGQQWFNGTTLFVWDGNAWVPVAGTKTTISATAPPSPSPGDLWFDGTQLRIWGGTAWNLVGPGATVGPVPTTTNVFSLVQPTSVGGGPANSFYIVPFTGTPTVDTQGGWDATTHRYVPKVPGNYLFFTAQYLGGGETGATHTLLKNDSGSWVSGSNIYVIAQGFATGSPVGDYLSGTGMIHMNGTTDYVRFWNYSSDGAWYPLSSNNPAISAWLLP